MKIFGPLVGLLLIGLPVNAQIQSEIFEFECEGVKLNGILNTPEKHPPKGLVLIVHGSGQTNAVEQEWHYDVRELFVRTGYAVYMWDKVGCGKSGGTFDYNQSVQSSAQEVIAAIRALQEQDIPGSNSIGLWGISRAGWINPLVINQFNGIKFWISVSGTDDKENFGYLLENNLRINGHSEDSISLLVEEWKNGNLVSHRGGSYEECLEATTHLRQNSFFLRFTGGVMTEENYYRYQKSSVDQKMDAESGLAIYIQDFDSLLSQITCPVLALFGEKDLHVDWTKTKLLYENTLGRNSDLTIKIFLDCNHNMFTCKTGGFYEFQDHKLPRVRCEGYLNAMEDWLQAKGL